MLNKIFKVVIGLLGVLLGFGIVTILKSQEILNIPNTGWLNIVIFTGVSLLFGLIFFSLSPKIIKRVKGVVLLIETETQNIPTSDIALGSVGLIVGLIIAYLVSQPLYKLEVAYLGVGVSIVLYGILGYFGIKLATRNREDIASALGNFSNNRRDTKNKGKNNYKSCPKILDTSVIIDGRIADICKTGFIEGPLIIPEFVLEELQHIADSSDGLKRNRGRRGLDILNRIQKELDIEIIIHDKKFEDVQEVDSKLLKLTQFLKGKIITNDYNLNKVAEVQGIDVLNINDLANAVKIGRAHV